MNLAQRSIYRAIDSSLKIEGLPPLRWYDVLWELEQADDGLRPFELESLLIFEQSNLSRLLRRIIDEGLVEERRYSQDGRGKILHITATGQQLRKRMWRVYGPLIQKHVGNILDQQDANVVAASLNSLIE